MLIPEMLDDGVKVEERLMIEFVMLRVEEVIDTSVGVKVFEMFDVKRMHSFDSLMRSS